MIETSNLTKKRIRDYLAEGKRFDGRKFDEYRDIEIEFGISKKAEGSAKVKIGKTEVWVGVKMDAMEPFPDSPDEGTLIVTSELLPMSHAKYEYGPPKFPAIELGRLVDRGIRESGYIDLKTLCIKEGEKVWGVFIDIYSINDDGNLLDAAFIGALAALKGAKIPVYDEKAGKIDYDKPGKQKLAVAKDLSLTYSVYKAGETLFLDPNMEEEAASEGRIVIGILNNNPIQVCSMQKSDDADFSVEKFSEALEMVEKKHKSFLEEITKKIDEAIAKNESKK